MGRRHVIGLLVMLAAAASALAAPQVDIRARTRLSLGRVKLRFGDQVEITGQLVDKLTGDGISGQSVVVTVAGSSETALTQTDGTFHAIVAALPGPIKVGLAFAGTRVLDRADPLTADTDPSKQQVELAIAKVADDPIGARLRVGAVGDDGPIALPIAISIAPQGSDAFHGLPGSIATNQVFTVARKDAGGPGMYRFRAAFVGDDRTQATSREVLLELTSETATTMTLAKTSLAYEDDLVATGSVVDDDAHPVADAAVTLTSGDRRLAQGTTDASGRYKFRVEAAVLGARELGVQVQADPGKSYVKPSRSPPVAITVAAPAPVPVSYTVAAFVATVLAAGAFFLARTKPWLRLRRPAPPADVPTQPDEVIAATGGLVAARPGIVSTLRRAADDGFAGVVRDTVRGRPIADAVVRIVLATRERELRTGDDGTFALEGLDHGEWRAEVAAGGHVTERFAVTIPHRGELRGVRVDLVPVRERVFQLYRKAAEPVLPEARLWGIWSPRQIVDHVRTKRPTPALAELTDFVEEVYFSPRLVAETVLEQAQGRVERAIHERANRPGADANQRVR